MIFFIFFHSKSENPHKYIAPNLIKESKYSIFLFFLIIWLFSFKEFLCGILTDKRGTQRSTYKHTQFQNESKKKRINVVNVLIILFFFHSKNS